MIERRSGVALWRQIADRMRFAINNGDYDDSGMMPPETALAEAFGVNRHTVRSAIASLAEEGMVRAVQGVGTLIERRDRLTFPIGRRTRFSQGLGSQAKELEGRLVEQAIEPAPSAVRRALGLAAGAECARLETVGIADGKPISAATSYFPDDRFFEIGDIFKRTGSITKALAELGIDDYVRHSTEISAVHAEGADLRMLKLSPGAILLVTTAINADTAGQLIQYSRSRFAADRVKFFVET
jgi:GntR family phosphonate transport system transcriptional regulator